MLEAVKNREVDIVIVYDHDRLSRDPLAGCRKRGVQRGEAPLLGV